MTVDYRARLLAAIAFGAMLAVASDLVARDRSAAVAAAGDRADAIRHRLLSPAGEHVSVVAHRGDWRNAPENSLQAIRNSVDLGVDVVEIDVRRTRDGRFVLMHDATIDRTTTGKGRVSDRTLAELRGFRLRNGQGVATSHAVPTLEEALRVARGEVLLNLDKCDKWFDEVFPLLRRLGAFDAVILKSSQPVSKLAPELREAVRDGLLFMPIVKLDRGDARERIAAYERELRPFAYEVVFENEENLRPELLEPLVERGAHLWINTLWDHLCGGHHDDRAVDEPDQAYGWVLRQGATMIQTDRPGLLIGYLERRGRRVE